MDNQNCLKCVIRKCRTEINSCSGRKLLARSTYSTVMKPANDYRAGNPARYHAHWLLRDGDRIVGPVSLDLLERGIRAGKVPLDAEMALDGHDEWLPVSRVLPRVRPEVHLALPAPADTAPETPEALDDHEASLPASEAPAGERSHVRARNTCVFWPAPSPGASASSADAAPSHEPASTPGGPVAESSFVGEIVEGELVGDDEWKRATVRKRPVPLPKDWRQRTVLCAPDESVAAHEAVAAHEEEGPITERMGAPETDRIPNVGEPNAEEARDAQLRAWQATTQQRRIVRPEPGTPQTVAESRAQSWADQPWASSVEPAPDQPWHERPWDGRGAKGRG